MVRGIRPAAGLVWAAVPLVSLGLATPLVFLYPAIRRRRAGDWIALTAYVALAVIFVATLDAPGGSAADAVGSAAFLLSWMGGAAHALIVCTRVFAPVTGSTDAIATAVHRKGLREAARTAAQDPAIAAASKSDPGGPPVRPTDDERTCMGKDRRTAASFAWAVAPLVTFGLATVPVFVYPAMRLRRTAYWAGLAAYVALAITALITLGWIEEPGGDALFTTVYLLLWLGGTVHAFAIRSRVFGAGDRDQDALVTATGPRGL
jgi:hypothetical protein